VCVCVSRCPPCRSFTPLLAAFYDSVVEEDEDALEIVFVSSDQSEVCVCVCERVSE
jgi:hypothetical protein